MPVHCATEAARLARKQLYIGGRWRDAATVFGVQDPATGTTIAEVADGQAADALEALDAALAAQPAFGSSAPRQRADWLRAAFEALPARTEDLAAIITAETGKPLTQARGEVVYGAEFLGWFAEQTAHVRGGYGLAPDGRSRIVTARRAVGPSLLVTPWNFPLAMLTRKLGAALAAGCTTIIKPAPQTPLTATLLAEILHEIGLPAGMVHVVPTTQDARLSQVLMADARLRKISFTGSRAVGSTLIRQSAEHGQPTSMELGGNGPFLVFDDADVDAAVGGAIVAKFRNGGQSCAAANRFLLHRRVADEFTEKFVSGVRALRLGGGFDPATTIGPLIDARQRDKVADLVDDAIANGAKVHVGGRVRPGEGYFHEPTVLTDVSPTARIGTGKIFAPMAPLSLFHSEDEATSAANDTAHGLSAFVHTRDLSRALRLGEALEAGMVGVNTGIVYAAGAPFGGFKASGLGREGNDTGIDEYLETTSLTLNIDEPTSTSNNHSRKDSFVYLNLLGRSHRAGVGRDQPTRRPSQRGARGAWLGDGSGDDGNLLRPRDRIHTDPRVCRSRSTVLRDHQPADHHAEQGSRGQRHDVIIGRGGLPGGHRSRRPGLGRRGPTRCGPRNDRVRLRLGEPTGEPLRLRTRRSPAGHRRRHT